MGSDPDASPLTALITGGGGGLGAATAVALQGRGWRTVSTHRSAPPAASPSAVSGDLSSPEDIVRMVHALDGEPGALVHCAARFERRPLMRSTTARSLEIVAVNLMAADRLVAGIHDRFGRPPQRIVLVGSAGASFGASGITSYAASKTALIGYTRALAHDLAHYGTTVNLVEPGPMATPLSSQSARSWRRDVDRARVQVRVPAPDAVAGLIAYLLGPHAGNISAARLVADGGLMAAVAP